MDPQLGGECLPGDKQARRGAFSTVMRTGVGLGSDPAPPRTEHGAWEAAPALQEPVSSSAKRESSEVSTKDTAQTRTVSRSAGLAIKPLLIEQSTCPYDR